MTDDIRIADAYENNLKHVSLTIPKGKLVVFAGVSGSGKSSLAFDTIAVESSRQWQLFSLPSRSNGRFLARTTLMQLQEDMV